MWPKIPPKWSNVEQTNFPCIMPDIPMTIPDFDENFKKIIITGSVI